MDKEISKFLVELGIKVDNLIDKELEKTGYDRAYFEFLFKANLLNDAFNKIGEKTLIDDASEYHYCAFCGKEAFYFVDKIDGYVCAECFRKLKEEEK